ncbi:MAG TPA: hypothetical protein VN754_10300, partial [Candidatus Binataceae bacterium]|nr:hypothetical protein [Candidatus Binataceae bacterium]
KVVLGTLLVAGVVGVAVLAAAAENANTRPVIINNTAASPSTYYAAPSADCRNQWSQEMAILAMRGLATSPGMINGYRQQFISSGCSPASVR